MYKPKAIIVSGYFNPIQKDHLEYFELASAKQGESYLFDFKLCFLK
jgi:hypothetical protein